MKKVSAILEAMLTFLLVSFILGVQSQGKAELEWRHIVLDNLVPDVKLVFSNESSQNYDGYSFTIPKDLTDENFKLSFGLWKCTLNDPLKDNLLLNVSYFNEKWFNISWDITNNETKGLEEIVGATELQISFLNEPKFSKPTSSATFIVTIYFVSSKSCANNRSADEYFECKGSKGCSPQKDKNIKSIFENDVEQIEINLLNLNEKDQKHSTREEDDKNEYRCILSDLKRNGRPNCGPGCDVDEREEMDGDEEEFNYLGWHDVQYLMTIVMAGIFFILCPICIVIFLLYHRKMNSERRIIIERQLAVRAHNSRNSETGYNVGPVNDQPPSYADVHEIKTPPPTFESVIRPKAQQQSLRSGLPVISE